MVCVVAGTFNQSELILLLGADNSVDGWSIADVEMWQCSADGV